MIDFVETHVEFILEFLHMLFPLDGESFWPRNRTHPVTRPNAFVVLTSTDSVSSWVICGKKTPRSEVLILYTVIVVSIYNLTVKSENNTL
jgi:hypothetical protein